jgi:hypothetical protein
MLLDSLLLALADQLLRCPKSQETIKQEADEGNCGRAVVVPEIGYDLRQHHHGSAAPFELAPANGEGSQCATTTASGATIAATLAWLAQNAAIAGVAVFAIAVSSSTTVGR